MAGGKKKGQEVYHAPMLMDLASSSMATQVCHSGETNSFGGRENGTINNTGGCSTGNVNLGANCDTGTGDAT